MTIDRLLLIRQTLLPLLAEQGLGSVIVATSYQPTSQGRTNGPTLYFFQLPTTSNYGWQGRSVKWDTGNQELLRTESQIVRESFQMMALDDTGTLNVADMLNTAKLLVASEPFREAIKIEGVGIDRVTAVRSPDFSNDRERNEHAPSFDFTLSYTTSIIQQARVIERTEINLLSV